MFDNSRLKKRRLDMGLTLEEVGNVVGISRSAVQKYEKGIIKNVYISTVELFAKALRCSPSYLMCWTEDPSIDKGMSSDTGLSSKEKMLITAYRNNPSMQGAVDKLLNIEKSSDCEIASDMCEVLKQAENLNVPTKQK